MRQSLVLLELPFEAFEQCERIRSSAGEAGEHLVVVELANLAGGALDDDVAQGDLAVAADRHLPAAVGGLPAHADDGRAVKLFHSEMTK